MLNEERGLENRKPKIEYCEIKTNKFLIFDILFFNFLIINLSFNLILI